MSTIADRQTLDVYAKEAGTYAQRAKPDRIGGFLEPFIALMPAGAVVLDLGCGSGWASAMMQDKGFEQVIATCSESADVDGIKNDFAKNALTTVPNFTQNVGKAVVADTKGKRAIAVVGKVAGEPATTQNAVPVAADKRDVARAAIKVEVK